MIVAGSASPLLLASAGGYNLTNSLRFRSSASAYLNRTLSSGNRQTWTYSAWVKRGALSADSFLLSTDGAGGFGVSGYIRFNSDNTFKVFFDYNGGSPWQLTTTQVFRDPSAWYHIVVVADTTNATSSNRLRLYVNGTQVTSFSSSNYPSQNANGTLNQSYAHYIGCYTTNGFNYDGYQAETNFVDGQALTPSSFGSTNATTGVWQPKKYSGTYGTNGFYLPFTNNSTTTTLGNDFSGNGNNWTTNNISLTAGSTYDSMTDVPTLTSATAANFCVLNAIYKSPSHAAASLSNGNLTATATGSDTFAEGTFAFPPTGKYYYEVQVLSTANLYSVGTARASSGSGTSYVSNGQIYQLGSLVTTITGWSTNDILGIAVNMDTNSVTFYRNNSSVGSWTAYADANDCFPASYLGGGSGGSLAYNFGQRPFAYTPPTGFVALNTFNLPTPTIGATASTQANKYMDATLYTGTGATATITNSGAMQPDLVWVKVRSTTGTHILTDSVRGANKQIYSNLTNTEGTATNKITGFTSTGFTLGADNGTGTGDANFSGSTYVGWQWRASGTTVSNTAGSITSTVSVNASSGFSIVSWVYNSGGGTIGHGLGVAPKMIIQKARNQTYNWDVYQVDVGPTKRLILNNTNAPETHTGVWNNTAPTSTVFSSGSGWYTGGDNIISYCFAQIAGYSAFGSYTGNGSTDGTFVHTGFRPAFLMIKRTDSTGEWWMYDNKREPINVMDTFLMAQSSSAEVGPDAISYGLDFTANGFKWRSGLAASNGSGGTYIYMAFAENPFKYSLAR